MRCRAPSPLQIPHAGCRVLALRVTIARARIMDSLRLAFISFFGGLRPLAVKTTLQDEGRKAEAV